MYYYNGLIIYCHIYINSQLTSRIISLMNSEIYKIKEIYICRKNKKIYKHLIINLNKLYLNKYK